MKILVMLLLFLFISCKNDSSKSIRMNTEPRTKWEGDKPGSSKDSVTEFFNDSLNIGVEGKHRVELKRIIGKDSIYADIRFFEKQNGAWIEKQHFALQKDGVTGCYPEFKDFNNDGFKDLTYKPTVSARGANDIRNLFLFDPKLGKLKLIKNSPDYPNLQYNEKLGCFDAFAVYGGSTSYFLKIDSDTLRQFARIDLFEGYREVYKINKYGKETLVKREPFQTSYLRYKNFDPLEEYEEF